MQSKSEVVALSGSKIFKDEFLIVQEELESKGRIVVSYNDSSDNDSTHSNNICKQKIDMADVLFVINKNGYIDEHTNFEIEYAESVGKQIAYLESCGSSDYFDFSTKNTHLNHSHKNAVLRGMETMRIYDKHGEGLIWPIDGQVYTTNQMIDEIKKDTELGKKVVDNIYNLILSYLSKFSQDAK